MIAPLSEEEQSELLGRARRAASMALGFPPSPPHPAPTGRLAEPGAAFVTWKRDGRLRGCIGSVKAIRPLAIDVESNAVSALLHDPRFPPAAPKEFPRYRAEVSVLSPMEEARGPADIEVGRHGIWMEKGRRAGLLLPQVPVEWRWDVETFLSQGCLKAGLPQDEWKKGDPAFRLWRFTAEVFGEPA